jgi:hypothetical protein
MLTRETLLARIRGAYREMPGLRLTIPEACRLWRIEARLCRAILQELVADRFLARMRDGAFVKRSTMGETV